MALETKGWILVTEPYNQAKLINILATTAVASKLDNLKQAALAVAFILNVDVSDHLSDTLANAVASKMLGRIEGITNKLSSMADFLAANDTKHAKLTLTLKTATDKLLGLTTSIRADALNTRCPFTPSPSDTSITWASIAKAAAKHSQMPPAPYSSTGHSLMQNNITWV
ncbi:hypothetical protein C0992_007061 [Termitomyces sp. T32_za158]|nr:hypothetical protein C0992_007061 [Termitomyces sp. T32_za158]